MFEARAEISRSTSQYTTPTAAPDGYPTSPPQYPGTATSSTTPVRNGPIPTPSSVQDPPPGPDGPWGKMGGYAHNAIIVCAIIGVIMIIFCSIWFCCGCCGLRKTSHRQRQRPPLPHAGSSRDTILPMHTIQSPAPAIQNRLSSRLHSNRFSRSHNNPYPQAGGLGGDAPPSYEEVVPPEHVRLAGGMRRNPEMEAEDGMVADGKTPLSEIPFEDVVLDQTMSGSSESSARGFAAQNHTRWGDTTGHTNS